MEERKTGLAPLCPGCARVLVLGSMPSEKSIAAGFYYANPRNAFWPILAALYGEADEGTPEGRIARLGAHGVALWDSAASCFRRGSLDSAIRAAEINDIPAFLAACAGSPSRVPDSTRWQLDAGVALVMALKPTPHGTS